jgi:hypothetical protein
MYGRWMSWLRLLLVGRTHCEVDGELEFHLEREIEANVASRVDPMVALRCE